MGCQCSQPIQHVSEKTFLIGQEHLESIHNVFVAFLYYFLAFSDLSRRKIGPRRSNPTSISHILAHIGCVNTIKKHKISIFEDKPVGNFPKTYFPVNTQPIRLVSKQEIRAIILWHLKPDFRKFHDFHGFLEF